MRLSWKRRARWGRCSPQCWHGSRYPDSMCEVWNGHLFVRQARSTIVVVTFECSEAGHTTDKVRGRHLSNTLSRNFVCLTHRERRFPKGAVGNRSGKKIRDRRQSRRGFSVLPVVALKHRSIFGRVG